MTQIKHASAAAKMNRLRAFRRRKRMADDQASLGEMSEEINGRAQYSEPSPADERSPSMFSIAHCQPDASPVGR
jgi:hypothetical protein